MPEFKFTKQKHTSNTNVWYDNILIGELSFYMKDNFNTPPQKPRSDAPTTVSTSERFITGWKAHTAANITTLGVFMNKESAAQAILTAHRATFKRENENDK